MKAKHMQIGIPYIVTRRSRHREFQPGDRIELLANGSINNAQAGGWMEPEHVAAATLGMRCEIDTATIEIRRGKLRSELAALGAA